MYVVKMYYLCTEFGNYSVMLIREANLKDEIVRRRDMRDELTFTIDPADAKDFDDALSFRKQDDGTFLIGVHIADVTHYVHPGDDIDNEAYERGTSIYYVDHVAPMLPEELCNDLCSLRPNEDKLCMSVIFTMDSEAQVLKYKVCRTVIRSDYRFNYDEVWDIMNGRQAHPISDIIFALNDLAKKMRQARMDAGALALEQDEVRFRLDENGHPTDIYFEQSNDAHHLIEEFMLLANRTIATEMGRRGHEFVYRVHDKPDYEKLGKLAAFKRKMGDRVLPSVIELLTIRAMAKAVYSTKNIGHYGLAFDYYTHFTSPIRRYPDMMVHRLVAQVILGERTKSYQNNVHRDLEEACEHCSAMEQNAQMEERDSVMQTIWMHDHLGEEFVGTIVSVTEFGVFVQLEGNRCEGLIHITDLVKGDYMFYDEKNYRLIGEQSGKTFTIGDKLKVLVVRADIERHQIDLRLADIL